MHHSKLEKIFIDCADETTEASAHFWSNALGMAPKRPTDAGSPYLSLTGRVGTLEVGLQRVNASSRFHLDIETDDVEAEVRRLEKLGARRKALIETWWVMEDPSGLLFCVVEQYSEDFVAHANVWDE